MAMAGLSVFRYLRIRSGDWLSTSGSWTGRIAGVRLRTHFKAGAVHVSSLFIASAVALSPVPALAIIRWVNFTVEREGEAAARPHRASQVAVFLASALVPLSLAFGGRDDGGVATMIAVSCGLLLIAISLLDAAVMIVQPGSVILLSLASAAYWGVVEPDQILDGLAGAALGYGLLAGVAWAYRVARGVSGLGAADPTLMAACGLLLGWTLVPLALVAAAGLGLAFVGLRHACGGALQWQDRMPFAPCLAAGTWIVWNLPPFH
jgi:hypothetical protein